MTIKAVLFDLDGTLINSIRHFRDALATTLKTYNVKLDEGYFWFWHANRVSWPDLFDRHGLSQIIEEAFKTIVMEEFARSVNSSVQWNDGALELVLELRQRGIKTGIVTNASRAHITLVEQKLSLSSHFDAVITGEEVGRRRKPEPFGLQLALDKLQLLPNECIYVGDQLFDMQAAKHAGIMGVLFKTPEALDASAVAKKTILVHNEILDLLHNKPD